MRFPLVVIGVAIVAIVAIAAARECTMDDWRGAYTACREAENMRDLLWYRNPLTDECSGGVPQPANKFGLRCDIACTGGQYLPLGSETCAECGPGEFSIGGGVRVAEWGVFPRVGDRLAFRTRAIDVISGATVPGGAGAWHSTEGGFSLRSGEVNNTQASILELTIHVVTSAGAVQFEYTVDAEVGYDGLSFALDGVTLLPMQSSVLELTSFVANLTRGYHSLVWRFEKDASVSQGEDAAFIKTLEIRGIDYADDSCTKCSPGYHNQLSSQSVCPPCPRNTISNVSGATSCMPCPSDKYAIEGSAECLPRAACSEEDYVYTFTACEMRGGLPRRDKIFSWLPTTLCDY
jgi:hypothetical protein